MKPFQWIGDNLKSYQKLLFYDFGGTVSNHIKCFPVNCTVRKRGKARNLASAAGNTIFKRTASSPAHV